MRKKGDKTLKEMARGKASYNLAMKEGKKQAKRWAKLVAIFYKLAYDDDIDILNIIRIQPLNSVCFNRTIDIIISIIRLRKSGYTLEAVGAYYELSRERVRQIQNKGYRLIHRYKSDEFKIHDHQRETMIHYLTSIRQALE